MGVKMFANFLLECSFVNKNFRTETKEENLLKRYPRLSG